MSLKWCLMSHLTLIVPSGKHLLINLKQLRRERLENYCPHSISLFYFSFHVARKIGSVINCVQITLPSVRIRIGKW